MGGTRYPIFPLPVENVAEVPRSLLQVLRLVPLAVRAEDVRMPKAVRVQNVP